MQRMTHQRCHPGGKHNPEESGTPRRAAPQTRRIFVEPISTMKTSTPPTVAIHDVVLYEKNVPSRIRAAANPCKTLPRVVVLLRAAVMATKNSTVKNSPAELGLPR